MRERAKCETLGRGLKGASECDMWVKDGWRLPREEARVMGVRTGCSCEGVDVDVDTGMDVDVEGGWRGQGSVREVHEDGEREGGESQRSSE